MNEIQYQTPYFNDTDLLRKAYQAKYPNYDYDMISVLIVGALSVYVPTEKFDKLILDTLKEAKS
jgi:hypothetical protein